MGYETSPKGDAFIRYYFIDRGGEEDLDMSEAMDDFEKFIYEPIVRYVLEDYVIESSIAAIEGVLGEEVPTREMTEEELLLAAQAIGLDVLNAFKILVDDHKA